MIQSYMKCNTAVMRMLRDTILVESKTNEIRERESSLITSNRASKTDV